MKSKLLRYAKKLISSYLVTNQNCNKNLDHGKQKMIGNKMIHYSPNRLFHLN